MTVQEALDACNPSFAWDAMRQIDMGTLVAGLLPRIVTRSGLDSAAAQVHNSPGLVSSVNSTAGTPLAIVHGSAPDAGEVRIEYTAGVATLTFAAAVTGYTCACQVLPTGLAALLAADSGAAV